MIGHGKEFLGTIALDMKRKHNWASQTSHRISQKILWETRKMQRAGYYCLLRVQKGNFQSPGSVRGNMDQFWLERNERILRKMQSITINCQIINSFSHYKYKIKSIQEYNYSSRRVSDTKYIMWHADDVIIFFNFPL